MKNGVTPVTAIAVTPVLYVDVDVVLEETDGDALFLSQLAAYPGLQTLKLTSAGPSGHPIYRVEGPLPALLSWFVHEYNGGDTINALDTIKEMKLAR
jgi:hypothetical protein